MTVLFDPELQTESEQALLWVELQSCLGQDPGCRNLT